MRDDSICRRKSRYTAFFLILLVIISIPAVTAEPLPDIRHIFIGVANDDGVKYDLDGPVYGGPNNTYYIKADGGGLNELHISDDVSQANGQVSTVTSQSGTFYVTNTGGRGFDDDIVILLAVNGTIPDDFSVHIKTSGYNWTTSSVVNQLPADFTYVEGAVDETFTKADFIYGPQTWKPGPGTLGVPSMPLYFGQDISDTTNTFQLMFIDLKVGNMYPSKFSGVTLEDNGAAKVEFSFTNLTTLATFNGYGWCLAANQGQGISWTNRMDDPGASGFSVVGVPYVPPAAPVADFTANPISGEVPLVVQFSDSSTGTPTTWAWDFDNNGIVDSTEQNPSYTYSAAGTYSVNLTVMNERGSNSRVRTDYISVLLSNEGLLLAQTAWPERSHDSSNSGQSPYNGPQTNTTKWITQIVSSTFQNSITDASINHAGPAIGPDGIIYLGTRDDNLYAVYPNGTIMWSFTTGDDIYGTTAVCSDGTVYIGSADDNLYAINPDGTEKWRFNTDNDVFSSPAIGSDGTVYFGSRDNYVYALNPDSSLKWRYDTGSKIESSPAIGSDGTVYIGSRYKGLYALNPDGSLKWVYATAGNVYNSPAIGSDGTIYFGTLVTSGGEGKILYAINPDGSLKWKYNAGLSIYYSSPVIGPDDTIYVASTLRTKANEIGLLHAVAPDGTLEWTCTLEREGVVDNEIIGTPAVGADGTIYIGGFKDAIKSGALYAVNPDGSIKWWYTFENEAKGIPAIGSDGTLYYGAGDGYLYAFENVVDFTSDATEGMSTLNVQFTGSSTRDIASWSWDFGDGTTSTEQNPSHTYSTDSTESYTVSLTVTDTAGTSYTAEKPGYITVWNQPVAGFDADLTAGQVPMKVNFTDTSANTPTTWLWDFGDGSSSTEQNPQHIYLTSGTFSVTLTVDNPAGTDTLEKNDYITSGAQPLPVPDFNSSVTSGIVPFVVSFTDLSSGSVNSWFWDFGDDTNSTEQNPVHTYTTQGTYSVGLTVTNYGGANNTTKEDYILVTAQSLPVAAFNASTTLGQPPLTVTFTDESTGAPFISWFWEFGDGTNSTKQNPVHTYTVHGIYDVKLTTTNYEGPDTTLKTGYIVVNLQDPPVASFTTNTTSGSSPLYVAFTDSSTGYNITSWFWEFGDGTNSTKQNPVHAYPNGGTFTVTVTVTNDNGSNTTTKTDLISVSDLHPPTADLSASKTAGKAPLVVQFHDKSTSTPKEWLWEFGDGTSSTEQNPVHTYSEIGVYTVTLTVTNDDGTDSLVRDRYITTTEAAEPLPDYNDIFVTVANDAGVKYDDIGNNTYHILFEGVNRGLNALHISTDPSENSGQVTVSENKSGTFYVTDSGGKGYEDEIILMVAVNGTIPEDFRLHITADGYTWTPNPDSNSAPDLSSVVYQPVSLDETFTVDDFIYGPHIWKPSGNGFDFPIYYGQNISDTKNTFQMMFIDLNAGVLGRGESLENRGAVRVNYTFENLNTFAAFNVYAYCQNANSGGMRISWTNHVGSSGYTVITEDLPDANFSANPTYGVAPLNVQFTDVSTGGTPVQWAWDFDNDGMIDSTDQNPTYTYTDAGVYSVNLTVTTSEDESDSLGKANYISVASSEGPLLADSAWPKFGHDGANTGQSPFTGSQSNTTKWTYYSNGSAFTSVSPVSGPDGTLYIMAEDNTLHAIYPNGTAKWQYTPGSGISEGSVAVGADGTIYFGSRDSNLYAVHPDGTLKWKYATVGRIGGSPAIGADGTIYIGGWYEFYALNPDGTLKWNYTTERFFQCCPVVGQDGTVYIGDYGGTVYAFKPDGSLKWSYATGSAIRGAPAMGTDGTLYIGNDGSKVYAFNPDGTVKWTYTAQGQLQGSVATGTDGYIYAGDRNGRLYALDQDGTLKWSYITGGNIRGSSAIGADGTVYFGSDDNAVYAIDSDGTLKWSYSTGDDIRGSPSIGADGTVYVASRDKYLYAFGGTVNFTADFFAAPLSGDAPLEVQFTDASTGIPTVWNWDFGDGSTSAEQNPVHSYTTAGNFTVNLTVTNADGSASIVKAEYVNVTEPLPSAPAADFTASAESGVAPLFVRFTDTSTNTPTSWTWHFGDGGTSTDQNPTHTYMTAGAYTVTLIVTNPSGSDNEVKTGIITVAAASTASGLADSAWPKFGGNAQNTGQSPYVGSKTGTPKWSYTVPGISGSSFKYTTPVIGLDGTIYLGDTASNISAINPDGTLKWETAIGIGSNSPFAIGTDGTLFVGGFDTGTLTNGKIYAVNPSDGTKKWTSSALTGACVYNGPAIGADGTVYGGNYLDQFCALFPENGTSKWSYTTGQIYNYGSPAIGYDGIVYVTSQSDKMLYAINPDGSPRWNFTAGGAFLNSPTIGADGTIYVACYDKNLYAINPDGSQKWNYTAGNYFYTGSPAVANDGTIYAGNQDKNVYAIDSEGNLKWKSLLASRVWSTPTIGADGTVYIEDQNSILYALNPANGNQIWSYTTSGRVDGAASIAPDGTVYVATENRVLYAFPGVVDFTSDKTNGSAPLAVQFNGISPLAVTAWNWDFGDGSTSTEQNPEHTYTAAGNYTVTLNITHADGTNFLKKPDYFTVNAPEPRTWTVGASGCDFTNITDALSNSSLRDGDTIYVYNGTYTHTSTLTVLKSITLTGEGASGVNFSINKGLTFSSPVTISGIRFKDSTSSSFYFRGADTVVKNCIFENGKKVYLYGLALRFENNTVIGVPLSSNNDDQLFLNNSFSDLSSDKGLSVKGNNLVIDGNSFSNYGTSGICFDSALTNMSISRNNFLSGASILLMEPAPGVTNYIYLNNFLTTSDIACNGVPLGTNIWNTTNPVTYTYLTTGNTGFLGNYWASRYTGIDGNGDGVGDTPYTFAILSTSMTDYAPLMDRYEYYFGSVQSPTASFDSDIQSGTAPLTVNFTDTSTGSPTSWAWDFENDGVIDNTEQNPSHIYTSAGTYTVNLTVTNPGGSDGEIKRDYITVSELSGPFILPDYNYIFVRVANDAGVKYDSYLNNTYNIRFAGAGRGLNAHHITTDPVFAPYGQVTSTTNKTGIFYITDTGGSGFADNVVIMVAANGTIPDNFSVHIRTSGYNWTPMPGLEEKPPQSAIQYLDGAVDETFTRDDLLYGPMTWKPSGETNPYPIYAGQDMANSSDTFHYMFVDAYVGQLGTNSGMSGLTDSGAVKVEYTIENIPESVVFNSYCWNSNANQGPSVIAWTNNLIGGHNGDSGYSVLPAVIQAPVAAFACDVSDGQVPLIVQFTDASTGNPTSWAWDFNNDGIVDSTDQNPIHTYTTAGTFTINLTVTNTDGSDSEIKAGFITVGEAVQKIPIAEYHFDEVTGIQANDTSGNGYHGIITGASHTSGFIGNGILFNGVSDYIDVPTPYFPENTFTIQTWVKTSASDPQVIFSGSSTGNNKYHPIVGIGSGVPERASGCVNREGSYLAGTSNVTDGNWHHITFVANDNGTTSTQMRIYVDGVMENEILDPSPIGTWPNVHYLGKRVDGYYFNGIIDEVLIYDTALSNSEVLNSYQSQKANATPVVYDQTVAAEKNTAKDITLTGTDINNRPLTFAMGTGPSHGTLGTISASGVVTYTPTPEYFGSDSFTFIANNGAKDSAPATVSIIINVPPVVDFTADTTDGVTPLFVRFTDTSVNLPTSWIWDFGDGSTSIEQNATHSYIAAGTYTVTLNATNFAGSDIETKTDYITVTDGGSIADFTTNVTEGTAPLKVQFTDTSTGNPTSWAWDFENDGVVDSTEQNPIHTYTTAGTFTVNLTVINDGGSNSKVKTDYISVSGSSGASVLPGYNYIFVRVANDDGVKYNAFDNDTYNIRFEGVNRGLNALHISTDPAVNFGQVTVTDSQSGTFYATDSGGKGYEDEVILLVAVNGTIPDDFSLRITSDGYTWTPNPVSNQPPSLDDVTYQPVALDETFTREDFIYGPQIWKPTGNEADYPIYAGQDLSDTENTFQLMFVDLNAGVLRPDTGLENQGAVRINYTFTNLDSFATFSVYAYCQKSNNGDDMVAWTNALTPDKAMSGYSVFGKEGTTPVAEFNANITSGTSPLSVQFTDMSAGSPTAWSWSFGDGYTSAEQSPVHTYSSEGSYQVNLTVSNEVGTDTREKEGYITVTSTLPKPPLVNFIGDNRTGPAPLTVHFTDQSTNTPTTWAWDFENDGIIDSTEQNPTHTYTTAGTYQVNLTASNAGGSANRLKGNYIQVTSEGNSNPVVDFSADSRDGTAPFTVQFTDLSVTAPTAWAWDFENDGVIDSTLQNPAHTYTIPGTYQVNLSVTNASGTANRLKANFIHVSAPSGTPVATFTVDTGTGRAPCFVRFTDTSTGDRITGYEWDFGDGAISTQKNPTHLYRSAGTYTVTLNVISETGTGTATGTIKVTGGSITPGGTLNARFTSSPTAGRAPLEVQFTDRSTGATTWNWDFGDGSTSTEQNPVHIFTTSGTYKVTLSVNGTEGSDSTTGTIMVIGTAVTPGGTVNAQFTSSPMVGRAPLEVQFTDRSSGATTWNWNFGDGSTSTEQNPVHVYSASGTYKVSLSVSGTDGTDITTGTIMVTGGAVTPGGTVNAQFISNPMVGRAPLEIQFTDRSTGATTWNWNFGDGSTSTEQNPVHVYSTSGTYKVTLSISGTEGSDSTTGTVMVISGSSINPGGKTNAQFTASPKVGRAPLEVQFSDRSSWATNQSWDFGDGMNSTELNPVHIFTDKGTYKVSLTVTIGNNIESATETIWVI